MKAEEKISTHQDAKLVFERDLDTFMEKLAKAKIDFDSLSKHISQGLARCEIICNTDGIPYDYRILSANKAYEKHTGIKRELAIGKTILEIYPDIEKSWIETYGRVALTQKPEMIEGYNHNTKRHYRSIAYSDKRGEFMMLFEDTTHQKEIEKAYDLVTKSTQFSSDIINNMIDGYKRGAVICDENNNPIDFEILEINDAYAGIFGLNKKDVVGKTMLEMFPTTNKEQIELYCNVGLSGKPVSCTHFCNYTKKVFDLSIFSPKSGEFVMFVKDITEKENARLKLEKAYQKVEESEQLKSTFLANMSHEIRTPLNAILGFAELLEDEALDADEEKKCLDNIKNSGNRLLNIVSAILDISKLEANQQQLLYESHNLNDIMDRIHEQFKIINIDPELEITVSKGLSNRMAIIETDATRLEQILSNLLENALKHTEKGWIRFGYKLEENLLEFYVEDTGSGIEKSNHKTIFERFGQVNNKTEINQGTGLGIPIAAGFAQLFGGQMWVDSEPDQGSTFYFTIPYRPVKQEQTKDLKPTILVAEDEEANFLLLEMWLKKYCNLVHAYDGNETVQLFKQREDIDLILMDIKMPYLNGIDATKQIREMNTEVPIIAQTAFVMEDEKQDIMKAGCTEILSKPIRKNEFKSLLTRHIPKLRFE